MKTGIEVEYWVVDDEGRLCSGQDLLDVHEFIQPEFVDSLIEIQTPPVKSESDIRHELHWILRAVLEEAERHGKHLVPLGTPLTANHSPIISDRGTLLQTIYRDGLDCSRNCAGTHLHFDKGNVTRQLNLLTALDPALALLSSSPYYLGERVATSSRVHAYRYTAGQEFLPYRDRWEYTSSVAEWNQRLQKRYVEFLILAADRGIPLDAIEELFQPENTVLTPVRLRQVSPTVEWRAPDAALPNQIARFASDIGRLMQRTANTPVEIGTPGVTSDRIGIPKPSELQRLTESAIRSGLDSVSVRTYLEDMTFDWTRYQPLSEQIRGPRILTEREARRIRLAHAAKLEKDVVTLRTSERSLGRLRYRH